MVYKATIICPNCGSKYTFAVPDGVLVKTYLRLKSEICSNCKMRIELKA